MAGTQRDRAGLLAIDTGTYIPDNTAGLVNPLNHRTSNEDINASTTNFLDDNFEINADGSHEYAVDPTGSWDGTAQHDLKFIPKKWFDDNKGSTISGTDNYIPIFNATSDNVEDSSLISVDVGDGGSIRTHYIKYSGINSSSNAKTQLKIVGSDTETQNIGILTEYNAFNGASGLPTQSAKLQATGNTYLEAYSGFYVNSEYDILNLSVGGSFPLRLQRKKSDGALSSSFANNSQIFAAGGDNNFSGFSINTNAGHLQLGRGGYTPNGLDSVLKLINFNGNGFSDRPHIKMSGVYGGAGTNGAIYYKNDGSSDRFMAFENGAQYNVITRDIFELTGTTDPGAGTFTLQLNSGVFSWI